MLFNSFQFIWFLPLVLILFYTLPHRFRWMMLLAASYYFYMCWEPIFVILLLISTAVDYFAALKMAQFETQAGRRPYMLLSVFVNLGMLFFFKYFNFFSYNTAVVLHEFNIFYNYKFINVLLPVGISFYTFQTLSYTLDVYRGKAPAEKHLGYFALYVTYFPQLVAGPIERAGNLIPQLVKKAEVTYEDWRYGINKILLGFFKKVVVADTLSIYVDQMFNNTSTGTGIQFALASIFFALQIFCDFSGYTDIAMGTARLMGVKLMDNFDRPLWVTSVNEFWSKWHISLTSWIGDYVFKPLLQAKKYHPGLIIVFVYVLIGFWHGAKWTFIIFGLYHGVVTLTQRYWIKGKIWSGFFNTWVGDKLLRTWNFILFTYSGIMFRANSVGDLITINRKLFTDFRLSLEEALSLYKAEIGMGFIALAFLLVTVTFNKELRFKYNWLYIAITSAIIIFFGQDLKNQFIYFQF